MRYRDLPIPRKLSRVVMITSAVVLALLSVALFAYEIYAYRETTRRTLSTLANIIATNSATALVHDDQPRAMQILTGLRADPEISAAALYDQSGRRYATYPATAAPGIFPAAPGTDGADFRARSVTFFEPVTDGQDRVGMLFLRADSKGMYQRLGLLALVLLAALMCVVTAAFSLSAFLQRLISQPLLHLARTARLVSEQKDYSIRAVKVRHDELGGFTDAFNSMLDQIQQRHAELRAGEERLSALFQSADEGIAHADLSGRFLLVNDRFCEMTGRSRESLLHLRLQDIVRPGDPNHHDFLEHPARHGTSFAIETRHDRPQGGFVWLRNRVGFIRNPAGAVVSALVVAEDITRFKQTGQELGRAHDEAPAAPHAKEDFPAPLSSGQRRPLDPALLGASQPAEEGPMPVSENQPGSASAPTAAANNGAPTNPPVPHGRILLIEDHAPTRATLQQLLVRRRYEVVAAGSVAEARALVEQEPIDFVISDIGLPDGNAYELMAELRAQRGLTGIALTGYGMESDIARSHAAGFVVHLTKPLRVQSLDEALAQLAGSRRR